MVALLFCADSIPAVFKGSLDPDPALLGSLLIAYPLANTCDLATSLFAKLEVSDPFHANKLLLLLLLNNMQAVPKFKNSAPGPDHTPFAGILSCVR